MTPEALKEEIREVDVEKITINPFQPRRHFSPTELEELAESIKAVGLIHPPVVRPAGDLYEIISGERRYRACKLMGLLTIPVVVRAASNTISAQASLIENIQRVDLNPIEIAKALRSLVEQFGFNQDDLALRIGKKRSTVANYLRLLALPKGIQDSVSSDVITMGHAKAILSLEGFEKQNLLHELILRDGQEPLLYGFNLLRIASLQQQLGSKTEELNAWKEWKQFAQSDTKSSQKLINHFKDGNVSITNYIEAREKKLKS